MEQKDIKEERVSLEVISDRGAALISSRGSVTVPKKVRKRFGLETESICGYVLVSLSSENPEYNGLQGMLIYPVEVRPRYEEKRSEPTP